MLLLAASNGRYHFRQLHDDIDYILKAKYRNYWSKPKTLSKFNSSKQAEVDLVNHSNNIRRANAKLR